MCVQCERERVCMCVRLRESICVCVHAFTHERKRGRESVCTV